MAAARVVLCDRSASLRSHRRRESEITAGIISSKSSLKCEKLRVQRRMLGTGGRRSRLGRLKIAQSRAILDVIRGASSIISQRHNNDLEARGWSKNFC
jgi:hypothetical protein